MRCVVTVNKIREVIQIDMVLRSYNNKFICEKYAFNSNL